MAKNQNTEMIVPEIFTIGNLEINKATLIAKRDTDVKLVIQGVDDTAGYKQALKLRADYRTVRTTLEKYRKDIQPHQDFVRELKKATDELGAEAAIGETYFDEMMTAIDNEKERIRQEKEAEKQRVIQARINDLVKLGFVFDGETYTCPYDTSLFMSGFDLPLYDSKEFGYFIIDAETAHNKEQERIAAELLIQQQKETDERLRMEQEENDRLEREAELARQSNELTVKRTKLRLKELALLNFVPVKVGGKGGLEFLDSQRVQQFHLYDDAIEGISDDNWDEYIKRIEDFKEPATIIEHPVEYNTDGENISDEDLQNFWGDGNSIASGNPVSDPQQGYVANEAQEEAPELDYSLNDFENLTRASYNGTKKQKETILEAIASYKEAMNKF